MPNPVKGEIDITLAKKAYKFRIGFNEVCVLEESLGRPMQQVFAGTSLGFREIREVVYVGIGEGKLTRDEVGEALGQTEDFAALGEALRRSMELSMPHLFRNAGGASDGPLKGKKAAAPEPAQATPSS